MSTPVNSGKPKIAFLSSYAHVVLDPSNPANSGGAELQVALLAREVAAAGHDVVILGGDTGQPGISTLSGVRIRNAGKFHTGRMLEMLASIPRVIRLLRSERPQWVFVLGWTAWLFVLWLLRRPLGFRLGFICGLDTEVNGTFERENPVLGGLFVFAMRHCDIRFAMTRLQESLFHRRGLSCSFYRNLILPRQSPRDPRKPVDFLWVSRCREIKKPLLFVQLARLIPEASFEMICPPEDRGLYRQIEEAAQGVANLKLLPGVPYHEIQQRYDAARVFVNTSDWEGWPNSFIQAGQGHAALLSLRVRPDSLFDDYALGFCCDGNWQEFVGRAERLFKEPGLAERCGDESERFVRELHNNARETGKFLSALNLTCFAGEKPTA